MLSGDREGVGGEISIAVCRRVAAGLQNVAIGVLQNVAVAVAFEIMAVAAAPVALIYQTFRAAAPNGAGILQGQGVGHGLARGVDLILAHLIHRPVIESSGGEGDDASGAGHTAQQGQGGKGNGQKLEYNVVSHFFSPSILYPWPQTTFRYRGSEGLISIFSRRWRMWTATAPSLPRAASCHTDSYSTLVE